MQQLLIAIEQVPTYEEYVHYKLILDDLPGISSAEIFGYKTGVMPEAEWHTHDPQNEYFWNPIQIIEQTLIPVLAFFGEKDTQVDPFQGAQAY